MDQAPPEASALIKLGGRLLSSSLILLVLGMDGYIHNLNNRLVSFVFSLALGGE